MSRNLILSSDAYTISSNKFIGKDTRDKSVYNLTNRYNPANVSHLQHICKDSRMILWGVSLFIEQYLSKPITAEDLIEAQQFMEKSHAFGGAMAFDYNIWARVIKEYGGYLPVRIDALPEGSVFFPNEPVLTVTSLDEGFGEIAGTLESRLLGMVSIGSACATLCRHWLKHFQKQSNNNPICNIMIQNFGARACSSEDHDVLTGVAHLLSFNGTDNFIAAYYGKKNGLPENVGTSLHALAHRTVLSHDTEIDAFNAIMDGSGPQNVASYVADCFNYDNAVDQITNMAKHFPDHTFIIRADSGNHIKVNEQIIQACKDKDLFTNQDGILSPKNVRFIYGDSVNPEKADQILDKVEEMTGNRFGWGIFGVGGYIVNSCTRDTLSSAYKLAAKGKKNIPVVKLSESPGKLSCPGPSYLYNTDFKCEPRVSLDHGESMNSLMKTYYLADKDDKYLMQRPYYRDECLSKVRERCLIEFDKWDAACAENPTFGLDRTSLSKDIKEIQDACYAKYRN